MKILHKISSLLLLCCLTAVFAAVSPKASTSDAELIAFFKVLNKNEIAAAMIVDKKNASEAVKNYAKLMKKDHTNNLAELKKTSHKLHIQPKTNDGSTALKKQGEEELVVLQPLKSPDFDKTYIDFMVKGHTAALAKIDTYMDKVTNPALKDYLTKTRQAVAEHLEKAKAIQTTQAQ